MPFSPASPTPASDQPPRTCVGNDPLQLCPSAPLALEGGGSCGNCSSSLHGPEPSCLEHSSPLTTGNKSEIYTTLLQSILQQSGLRLCKQRGALRGIEGTEKDLAPHRNCILARSQAWLTGRSQDQPRFRPKQQQQHHSRPHNPLNHSRTRTGTQCLLWGWLQLDQHSPEITFHNPFHSRQPGSPGLRFSSGWFRRCRCPAATSWVLCRCETFSLCLLQKCFPAPCVSPPSPGCRCCSRLLGDSKVPLRMSIPALPGGLPAVHCEPGAAPGLK